MILRWTGQAATDLRAIYEYIDEDNPDAAAENDELIWIAARSLLEFPGKGRPGRVEGTRELVVHPTACILAYRVERDRSAIRILRVMHGAQRWPKRMAKL